MEKLPRLPFRGCHHWGVLLLICGLSACRGENLPEVTEVTGAVTFKGQPLNNGSITFIPVGDAGSTSASLIDAHGRYELKMSRSLKGIRPGSYKVRLESFKQNEAGEESGLAVPAKYADPDKSGLTVDVMSGPPQVVDFALEP